ncbi:MAG TPA: Rieske 2Fe-2S domain-containing protein [Chloroflexota bacterium]|nr:Rieske 2Fe-2S domain-containing protein [Chloroflexota bacterium]
MLSKEQNETITRVSPGTPMGEALRRYWMPALLESELPDPDCPPVRVRLLGEDLVAFKDTAGTIGLVAENCPHRGASLFFGRNEEEGLRCVYHGWKFNAAGTCVDMPNEPPESNFKHKVKVTAYPTVVRAGIVYTYMGPVEKQPPPPNLEWMRAPEGWCRVSKTYQDCNYVQALEGGLDTSHSSFLHRRLSKKGLANPRARSTHPRLEVLTTDYGYMYASVRHLPQDHQNYVRLYQYIMPFYQIRAADYESEGNRAMNGHIWVPRDDNTSYVYNYKCNKDQPLSYEDWQVSEHDAGRGVQDFIPGTFHLKANRSNDWFLDREVEKNELFVGIRGVNTQDAALQETMGHIFDRSKERLGTADTAIIFMRRLLLQAAKDVAEGKDPIGSQGQGSDVRPAEMLLPDDVPWHETQLKQEAVAVF